MVVRSRHRDHPYPAKRQTAAAATTTMTNVRMNRPDPTITGQESMSSQVRTAARITSKIPGHRPGMRSPATSRAHKISGTISFGSAVMRRIGPTLTRSSLIRKGLFASLGMRWGRGPRGRAPPELMPLLERPGPVLGFAIR